MILKKKKNESHYLNQLKVNAKFKLKHHLYKEAVLDLEKILKVQSNNFEALAQLIIAYSQFDLKMAEKYAAKLPRTTEGDEKIDAEALENLSAPKISLKQREGAVTE